MKKQAKKTVPPTHVKDPRKVAAGKARAMQSIRVDGKFTTNAFLQKVEQDAKDVGVKDPYEFYLQNQKLYETLYKNLDIRTYKTFGDMRDAIKNFQGKIFKNNKPVKAATAIKALNELNQFLRADYNVVEFFSRLEIGMLNGKLNINIPSIKDVEKAMQFIPNISKVMSEIFAVKVIISDRTKPDATKNSYLNYLQAKKESRARYKASEKGKASKARYKKTEAGKAEKSRYKAKKKK